MPFRDRYGYELTTSSPEAAQAYSDAVDAALAGEPGSDEGFARAGEADPGFALAEVARARQAQFVGKFAEARERKQRALDMAPAATRREQQHVAAMAKAIDGDGPGAVSLIEEHVKEFPLDAYLLSQAMGPFGLLGFGGVCDWRASTFGMLEPLAKAYGDDWWFLTTFAFAHNELYHFAEARKLAERGLELRPTSGHASHALAHVQFETGAHGEGATFLAGWLPGYQRAAILYSHLSWHLALFQLKQGNLPEVNRIYGETLAPDVVQGVPIIGIADAASLAWRCDLYGVERPAGSREALRDYSNRSFPHAGVTFADMHSALCFAAAGDTASMDRLLTELRAREAEGKQPAGHVVVALAEAIDAFGHGDYESAIRVLEPHRAEIVRVGGSNAQREVFEDTLLEAYLRAGRSEQAAELLAKRLDRRPSKRDAGLLAGIV